MSKNKYPTFELHSEIKKVEQQRARIFGESDLTAVWSFFKIEDENFAVVVIDKVCKEYILFYCDLDDKNDEVKAFHIGGIFSLDNFLKQCYGFDDVSILLGQADFTSDTHKKAKVKALELLA